MTDTLEQFVSNITYDAAGLVPAVVQDHTTGAVLMVAYMNRESLANPESLDLFRDLSVLND